AVIYQRRVINGFVIPARLLPIPLEVALDPDERPARAWQVDAFAIGTHGDDAESGVRIFGNGIADKGGRDADDRALRPDRDRNLPFDGAAPTLAQAKMDGSGQQASG